jgi:Secretion system C-terminal sorting domain
MKKNILILLLLVVGLQLSAQSNAKGGTSIAVFPNPATEFIEVSDNSNSAATIGIYNLVGRRLRSFEFSEGQQYIVSDLPKGMYLVQIVDRSGAIITTQKLNKR